MTLKEINAKLRSFSDDYKVQKSKHFRAQKLIELSTKNSQIITSTVIKVIEEFGYKIRHIVIDPLSDKIIVRFDKIEN